MYACILHEYVEGTVDVSRVIRMLLIHDMVKFGVSGATIRRQGPRKDESECKTLAAERVLGAFPGPQGSALLDLWKEFEASQSEDACFANALACFRPLLVKMFAEDGRCKESDASAEQLPSRYGPVIKRAAPRLWALCETWIAGTSSRPDLAIGLRFR